MFVILGKVNSSENITSVSVVSFKLSSNSVVVSHPNPAADAAGKWWKLKINISSAPRHALPKLTIQPICRRAPTTFVWELKNNITLFSTTCTCNLENKLWFLNTTHFISAIQPATSGCKSSI